jgi:hypothetical protein
MDQKADNKVHKQLKPTPALDTPKTTVVPQQMDAMKTKTLELKEMDGYTIIDGTPFPLDMFDDVEPQKTVVHDIKTESSTPIVATTSTETVVASQITTSSQMYQDNIKPLEQMKQDHIQHGEQEIIKTSEQVKQSPQVPPQSGQIKDEQPVQIINKDPPPPTSQVSGQTQDEKQVKELETSQQSVQVTGQTEQGQLPPQGNQGEQQQCSETSQHQQDQKETEVREEKNQVVQQTLPQTGDIEQQQQGQVEQTTSDKGQIKETDDKDSQPPIEKTVDTADNSEKSKPSHPDVVDVTDQFLQEKDGVKTQTQQKLEQQEPVVQQQQSGIPLVQDGSEHQQQSGTPLVQDDASEHQQQSGTPLVQDGSNQQQHSGTQQQPVASQEKQNVPQQTDTPLVKDKSEQPPILPHQTPTGDISKQTPERDQAREKESNQQTEEVKSNMTSQQNKQEEIKPITEDVKTLNDKRISNEAPQEQISGTTPVAEQLMSSMNINIPVKSETQQATVVLQENTDVKFGIANATETNLPPKTEPLVHDIYKTADFLTRKPLSHNTGANVASVQTENAQPDIKSPQSDQAVPMSSQETVTQQSIQEEIPSPPKREDVTVDPLGEASDHVLTRKINDEKLEEMEDKEFQDQQSWRIWFRSMEVKLKVVVEKVKTSNNH